ncbi:MAG: Ig-like domain repeat protein, partial [Rudaea sp.]|nr:Ig-like domain repeat protein [Rudaea sp.]
IAGGGSVNNCSSAGTAGTCSSYYDVEGGSAPAVTLTLTPAAGWSVESASGCGGSYTGGTTYVTSALSANCTVNVTFVQNSTLHFSVAVPGTATAGSSFTYTVTALDSGNNTVLGYDGSVHFSSSDGSATLPANSTLTQGAGSFTATLVTAGTQTITAADSASPSTTGTSGAINVTAAAATHFSVKAPLTATVGSSISFSVTAFDAFNNIATGYTGSAHFSSSDGTATLPANSGLTNGVGSFPATLRTAGTQTITVTDSATPGVTGTSNNITVSKATTTTTVASPSAISLGASVTVTATVTSTGGTPTGNVTITDTTDSLSCSYALSAPTPGCSLTPTSTGTKSLSASYAGDTNFLTSSSTVPGSLTVNAAQPGSTVSSSVNPSVFGQPVTVTATVTAPSGGVTPTSNGSNVHFLVGGSEICAGSPLTAGSGKSASATCAIPQASLTIGNHSVQFNYDGDANNKASSSTLTGGQTVNTAATTLTVDPPAATSIGQSVTVTVHVATNAPGAGTPDGSVTVSDGAANCVVTLSGGSGSCSLTPPAPAGSQTLNANYAGSTNFANSTGSASVTINAAATTTVVTSSTTPSIFGQAVTFTAAVSPASGAPAPTGTVTFTNTTSGATLCTGATLAAGSATCTASTLAVGNDVVQASYSGDANSLASKGALTQTVNKGGTTMTLTVNPSNANPGQTITLSATVFGDPPTGLVTFLDGATSLGSSALTATSTTSSVATFQTSSLGIGTHNLSATFAGDANNSASASAVVVVAVTPPPVAAPALSAWALLLLCASIAAGACVLLPRHR